jgi:hypothetical protein
MVVVPANIVRRGDRNPQRTSIATMRSNDDDAANLRFSRAEESDCCSCTGFRKLDSLVREQPKEREYHDEKRKRTT